jgi:hypothetical protein
VKTRPFLALFFPTCAPATPATPHVASSTGRAHSTSRFPVSRLPQPPAIVVGTYLELQAPACLVVWNRGFLSESISNQREIPISVPERRDRAVDLIGLRGNQTGWALAASSPRGDRIERRVFPGARLGRGVFTSLCSTPACAPAPSCIA